MVLRRVFFLASLVFTVQIGMASDVFGTFSAKVIWQSKSKPTLAQKKQAAEIEKQVRLVLFPDARYALVDKKRAYEGTWHVANGWFTMATEPDKPGGVAPLVAYKFSKDRKTLTPKEKGGDSYIIFVWKSKSTKL